MWSALSLFQRRVLIGLAAANVALLALIGALAFSPALDTPAAPLPSQVDLDCQSAAASALARRGVAGTVTVRADSSIDFTLGGNDPAAAWEAFAVSADMPARGCGPYTPIRVDVPDPSLTPRRRLIVEARWLDVQAWAQGRIDDAALSERTIRSTYTRAESTVP